MTIAPAAILACILVLSLLVIGPGYIPFLPHAPALYPDSSEESLEVIEAAKKRDMAETRMFQLTDASVSAAFVEVLPVPRSEIDAIANSVSPLILALKIVANRPRPAQASKEVAELALPSVSAHTPSFPSGHSAQAYTVASYYKKLYPELGSQLKDTAEKIGQARIYAGLHYPSDHEFSKKLVALFI